MGSLWELYRTGFSIALTIHSLDYYYEPTFALLIGGLNSYHESIVPFSVQKIRIDMKILSCYNAHPF